MAFVFHMVDEKTLVAALAWHKLGPSAISRETGLTYGKVQHILRADTFKAHESSRSLEDLLDIAHAMRDPESVSI